KARSAAAAGIGACYPPRLTRAEGRMLRSGEDHLESLRDGRVVYVGGERIKDVTGHPAVRNAARTVARVYDLKRRPRMSAILSFEADSDRFSMHFLLPRGPEDLLR